MSKVLDKNRHTLKKNISWIVFFLCFVALLLLIEVVSQTLFSSWFLLIPFLILLYIFYKKRGFAIGLICIIYCVSLFFVGSVIVGTVVCLPNLISTGEVYRAKAVVSTQFFIPARRGRLVYSRLHLKGGDITIRSDYVYNNFEKGDSVILQLKDGLLGIPILASKEVLPVTVNANETN